jgi:hypothetical protein
MRVAGLEEMREATFVASLICAMVAVWRRHRGVVQPTTNVFPH